MSLAARPAASGLRELVRHIIQRDVLRASAAKSRGWMVLVLDAAAARVLTPVLGLYDLVEERVTLVESLEKKRQPFPDMTAVYVVAATSESVAQVAADWRGPTADPYADAHVFTLDVLGDGEMAVLREMARKLRALVELRLDFLALEARAFSLDEPRAFRVAPGAARCAALDAPRDAACARKLANLLATLGAGAGVVVRHRAGNARARACGARLLDELAQGGGGGGGGGGAAPVVVLLVDRADDVLTPLVHEYSYQALVQDVLPVEGAARDRVRVADAAAPGAPPPDDAYVLSDRDALWVELRHAHVAAVVRRLRARTRAVLVSNRGAADLRRGRGGDLSLGEMAAALRRLPEFRAATAQLDAHMTLARAALAEFQRHRLLEQSQLEQTLATGVDAGGAEARPRDVLKAVSRHLAAGADDDRGDRSHALRLAAAYVAAACGRVAEAERTRLFDALRPDARDARRLRRLARVVADAGGLPTRDDAAALAARRARTAAAEAARTAARRRRSHGGAPTRRLASLRAALSAALSAAGRAANDDDGDDDGDGGDVEHRYAPPLKALVAALCDGDLDADLYPALGGAPDAATPAKRAAVSARKASSRRLARAPAAAAGAAAAPAFSGLRVVVAVLGGATYSELRAAYEVSRDTHREVILGGSALLAPGGFLASLAD